MVLDISQIYAEFIKKVWYVDKTEMSFSRIIASPLIVPQPIQQGGRGLVEISANLLDRHSSSALTVPIAATSTLAASALINSKITNTGAAGGISLTMPTAAAVLAAFSASGVLLYVGDTFQVRVTAVVAQSITLLPSASVTVASGAANVVIGASKSAVVTFTVLSNTVGAEAISFRALVSS